MAKLSAPVRRPRLTQVKAILLLLATLAEAQLRMKGAEEQLCPGPPSFCPIPPKCLFLRRAGRLNLRASHSLRQWGRGVGLHCFELDVSQMQQLSTLRFQRPWEASCSYSAFRDTRFLKLTLPDVVKRMCKRQRLLGENIDTDFIFRVLKLCTKVRSLL